MSESDLIYRRDAINAVEERIQTLLKDEVFRRKCGDRDLYGVKRLLQNLPSTNQWIPCSERLPMQTGEYLVTVHYRNWGYFVDVFGYTPTVYGWYDPDNTDFDWSPYVIAWMPLPDPWKGE